MIPMYAAKETLSTDVSGIVMEGAGQEGQHVRKGEVLLRLDPRQFQIAVQGATAVMNSMVLTLNAEKLDYNRMVRDADGQAAAGGGGPGRTSIAWPVL